MYCNWPRYITGVELSFSELCVLTVAQVQNIGGIKHIMYYICEKNGVEGWVGDRDLKKNIQGWK